jgi:hypothetical protein
MLFAQKLLAPGPDTRSKATSWWHPFQSALSASLFLIPPALPEIMIGTALHFSARGKILKFLDI